MNCDVCAFAKAEGWNGLGSRTAHCSTCHTTWSGLKRAHCTLCHRTFVSDNAAQRMHSHNKRTKCWSDRNLLDRGFVIKDDIWGFPPRADQGVED